MSGESQDRFIPGIYNYCDSWCERCAFTRRCRNFAMREEMEEGGDSRSQPDPDHAPTSGEINDLAGGIEFDLTEEELEETERELRRERKNVKRTGASALQTAEAYTWRLREFLGRHPALVPARDEDIDTKSPLKHATPADKGEAAVLHDALEVIAWHVFFITVKLQRAFSSLASEERHPPDWPPDSDGSAKVALIGMDRCLAAWEVVHRLLPEHGPAALDFMLRLNRLRTKVESQFPSARAFVRPGFDE